MHVAVFVIVVDLTNFGFHQMDAESAGLALLAYDGVAGDGLLGLRLGVLALPFAGALLVVRRPAA